MAYTNAKYGKPDISMSCNGMLAGLVATSRVYVKMHHASDVLVGAALGIGLGTIARRVLPLG